MNPTTVLTIVIAVAAVVWLSYRQTTWQPLSPSRAWRMPLILAGVGALGLFTGRTLGTGDLGLLILELVVGAAVGAAIGRIAHLRPVTAEALRAQPAGPRANGEPPAFEARNGVWGLTLWILLIAARVGLVFWISTLGVNAQTAPAAIIMLLGVNRLARIGVIMARARRLSLIPAR
jgi:hypothetical protein